MRALLNERFHMTCQALVSASLMLAGAALLACFFQIDRATRVNPIKALRTE